jgi:transcriptional regulator with XRE-family HTH domain
MARPRTRPVNARRKFQGGLLLNDVLGRVRARDMAQSLGVTRAAISSWRTHKAVPSLSVAFALEDRFHVPARAWTIALD